MNPYKLKFFHREKINKDSLISRDIYRFETRFGRVYFIEVECYLHHLYVAKFYLRIHKNLKNRYKLIINDGDGFRILSTCIKLALEIYSRDSKASFGYIGESKEDENSFNTQRYRVYSALSIRYFSPKKYDHFKDEKNSVYFLLNKSNAPINEDIVSEYLKKYFDRFSIG